ncbi:MAG: CAP domain-containing protein [Phycisphaerae bacterium]
MTRWLGWVLAGGVIALLAGGCPMTTGIAGPGGGGSSSTVVPGGGSSDDTEGPPAGGGTDGDGTTTVLDCDVPDLAETWAAEVLQLVNEERAANGLAPVTANATLTAQAEQYACEMVYYDFFAHVNPVTGSTLPDRSEEFGYVYQVIGENLAAGPRTPSDVMTAWMNSEGHRENILDPRFTELGVGVREGGEYDLYWVQEFGTPR